MSPHHNAVQLVLTNADESQVASTLQALEGVREVTCIRENGELRFEAKPEGDTVIVDRIANAVRDSDWELVAMYVERGRLDEVFREMTSRGLHAEDA
jgi:ABC-2 type transport system ATP-binding protein